MVTAESYWAVQSYPIASPFLVLYGPVL